MRFFDNVVPKKKSPRFENVIVSQVAKEIDGEALRDELSGKVAVPPSI